METTQFPLAAGLDPSIFAYNTTNGATMGTLTPTMHNDTLSFEEFNPMNDLVNATFAEGIASNESLLEKISEVIAEETSSAEHMPMEAALGVMLALFANGLIGFSVILKKQSLVNLRETGAVRASEGGFGYLKASRWWIGIVIMGLGEFFNFVAYIFAPSILVTPLAVFSILVTAALSPYMLKESLGRLGRLGCFLVLVGCLIVTLCGPKDQELANMDQLEIYLLSPGFIVYASITIVVSSILIYLAPKYGSKYIMIYTLIIALHGSCAVMFCKGVGLGLKLTIQGENAFNRWSMYVCFFAMIFSLLVEVVCVQRALDVFNSSILASVMYVSFVSLVILSTTLVFSENNNLDWKNIVLTLAGFLVNIVALILLNLDKDPTLSVLREDSEAAATSSLKDTKDEKTVVEQLYEIRRDSMIDIYGTPPCMTPMATPYRKSSIPSCNLPSISTAMFRESAESNSCLSLISEAPSSKNNYKKDSHSYESTDTNSQSSSGGGSDFRNLDDESGNSSQSCPNSFSSSGSGKRRQQEPDQRSSSCDDNASCVCDVPLIRDEQCCPVHQQSEDAGVAVVTGNKFDPVDQPKLVLNLQSNGEKSNTVIE